MAALQRTGTTLPPSVLDECRCADGVILGPVSIASYPPRDRLLMLATVMSWSLKLFVTQE